MSVTYPIIIKQFYVHDQQTVSQGQALYGLRDATGQDITHMAEHAGQVKIKAQINTPYYEPFPFVEITASAPQSRAPERPKSTPKPKPTEAQKKMADKRRKQAREEFIGTVLGLCILGGIGYGLYWGYNTFLADEPWTPPEKELVTENNWGPEHKHIAAGGLNTSLYTTRNGFSVGFHSSYKQTARKERFGFAYVAGGATDALRVTPNKHSFERWEKFRDEWERSLWFDIDAEDVPSDINWLGMTQNQNLDAILWGLDGQKLLSYEQNDSARYTLAGRLIQDIELDTIDGTAYLSGLTNNKVQITFWDVDTSASGSNLKTRSTDKPEGTLGVDILSNDEFGITGSTNGAPWFQVITFAGKRHTITPEPFERGETHFTHIAPAGNGYLVAGYGSNYFESTQVIYTGKWEQTENGWEEVWDQWHTSAYDQYSKENHPTKPLDIVVVNDTHTAMLFQVGDDDQPGYGVTFIKNDTGHNTNTIYLAADDGEDFVPTGMTANQNSVTVYGKNVVNNFGASRKDKVKGQEHAQLFTIYAPD